MKRLLLSPLLAAALLIAAGPAAAEGPFKTPEANAQYHIMVGELAALRNQPKLAAAEFLKALEQVPDADLAMRAASLALAAHDEPLALKAARHWLRLDANNMDAREAVARLALRAGDKAEAQAQCEMIIKGHAGGAEDGFRSVSLLLSLEPTKKEDALAIMETLRAQHEQLPGAWYGQSLLALRFGQLDLAERAAREALRLTAAADDKSEALLLLTGVLVRKSDLPAADRTFAELIKSSDEVAELRMGYARLLIEGGHNAAARAQYEAALAAKPDHAAARYALGLLALEQEDFATAEPHLKSLVESDRFGESAAYYLGRLEELRDRPEQALDWYAKVTHGDQAVDAMVRRAAVLGEIGKLDDSRRLLTQLRAQLPMYSTRFYLAEGEILLDANAPDQALALYREALVESPEDPDLLYGRSLVYDRLKKLDEAEADLRRILKQNAEDARALNALGYMLTTHTSRLKEAHGLIARALELSPDDAAVIDSMGWVEFQLGNLEGARTLLEKAFTKQKDPEIAAHLGEVLWQLGDRTQARAVWDGALQRDPQHRVLRETIDRLAK